MNLRCAGHGGGARELRGEFDLDAGREVLAKEQRGSCSGEGPLRRLRDGRSSEDREGRRQRARLGRVDEADATIGDSEEKVRLAGIFDFGWQALDRWVGDLAEGLQGVPVKNGDGRRAGSVIAGEQETAVPRKSQRLRADGDGRRDLL